MPCSKSFWVLIFFFGLAIHLLAATGPVPLQFDRLDLTDGRKLTNIVVKAYDARAGKLLLVASGKAMFLPIELIPQPFRDRFKAEAPRSGDTASEVPAEPIPSRGSNANRPVPPPAPSNVDADGSALQQLLAHHKQAALERAQNYYRFEFKAGSDASHVTALSFETEEPQPMDGWPGRYRTQGKVFLEYFDSKGRSFGRTWSTFEVLTEQRPGAVLKIVDFSQKS